MTSQTSYVYDGLNRLTGETLGAVTNTYAYDDYSNRASLTADGVTTNYVYDANNRLLSDANASYTYDANGNLTQTVLGTGDTAQTVTCTYDNFNRLKKVSDNTGDTVYTYDADGLRSGKTTGGETERYVWDGGQLVATIGGWRALAQVTMPSDGAAQTIPLIMETGKLYYAVVNGELYSDYVSIPITWLSSVPPMTGEETPEIPPGVAFGAATLEFGPVKVEDAGDRIVDDELGVHEYIASVTGPANATISLYVSESDVKPAAYTRGLGLIAATEVDRGVTYYHYNAHGDVVQLTDSTGALVKDYRYDAFGVEQNADDGDMNPFRYCGEQFDSETGNYYLRARYYTPGAGRFTQEDPARDGLNWYAYCAGNPVGFVDPSGFAKQIELEFSIAGAATDMELQAFKPFGQATGLIRTLLPTEGNQAYMNYLYNQKFEISGLINGQQLAPVSNFRYGTKTMSWNGCEVIANYNALILLGNPHKLNDVANWGENHGQILNGFFGTWPDSSRALFEELGYSVTSVDDVSQFDSKAANADACIFSFWNDYRNPLMGAHTIAIEPTGSGFVAYNFYGRYTDTYSFTTFSDMIATEQWHFKPIVLYCISEE